jgi:hypothetical protein
MRGLTFSSAPARPDCIEFLGLAELFLGIGKGSSGLVSLALHLYAVQGKCYVTCNFSQQILLFGTVARTPLETSHHETV